MLPKVFVSEPVNQKGLDILKDKVDFIFAPDTSKATAISMVKDVVGVLLRATTLFDAEVINAAPNLRVIARTGVGFNNVDVETAGARGVYVCTTPGTNNITVAEHTIAMIFALAKQVIHQDQSVRNQKWLERFSARQFDVNGKRIGIIGLGSIGKTTAEKCLALGLSVIAFDPFAENVPTGVALTSDINAVFKDSDFVSLHCPTTNETRGLVNAEKLKMMKPGAYLINTARGDLIVETDLIKAIEQEQIAGAALDVFNQEPLLPENPLMQLKNIILSPHVAGSTLESNERIAMAAATAIKDVLDGRVPNSICNKKYLNLGK